MTKNLYLLFRTTSTLRIEGTEKYTCTDARRYGTIWMLRSYCIGLRACTENLFKAVPVGAGAVFCNLTNKQI